MSDIRKYMRERNNIQREDEDEVFLEKKLQKHKRGKAMRVFLLLAVIVVAAVSYYIYIKNKTYTEYEILETAEIADTYNSRFYAYGDYILRYSEDGLAYLNGSETYWNQAFQMKEPVIDVCKDYVAVAEQKGNEVYICNTEAAVGTIETEYPIMGLDVSSDGVVAAITGDESDVSHIEVIDTDGTKIAKGQTVLSGQGCPIDLSISEDGTKLVVSYLYMASGVVESKVVFYNYSEVGKNSVDRFVGGYDYETTMMAKVEFLTNDIVVAFGDDKFVLYSMSQKPSVIAEISVENEIQSIFYNSEYIGIVVDNGEADNPYTMLIYNTGGDNISETKFNFTYKDIKIANKTVVIYNDNDMKVYTVDGILKYEGTMDEGITSVITTDKDYSYYIVGPTSIMDIKLK